MARIQFVESPLDIFELLPCFSKFSFCSQPLIITKIFCGLSDGRVKVRSLLRNARA